MFTGIVENKAKVLAVEAKNLIISNSYGLSAISTGQSISVSGCCLTVVRFSETSMEFEVSPETFAKTRFAAVKPGDEINLERGLRLGEPLDGHWVTGHIDATAVVDSLETLADGMKRVHVRINPIFSRWLVTKGSVSLDGVSLTVNDVDETGFSVVLIPHTLAITTLGTLEEGSLLNIEFDLFAKYVEKMMAGQSRTKEVHA